MYVSLESVNASNKFFLGKPYSFSLGTNRSVGRDVGRTIFILLDFGLHRGRISKPDEI